MVKKRSVFDINFDPDEGEEEQFPAGNHEEKPDLPRPHYIQGHPLQNHDPVPARRGS